MDGERMSGLSHHSEWLSLIEVSGPFLAEPVLKDAFPQGLEGMDPAKKTTVRQAYDEWREALDLDDPDFPKIHRAWIDLILKRILELDENDSGDVLKSSDKLPDTIRCDLPEHGITLRPDYAVMESQADGRPLILITVYDPDVSLAESLKGGGWAANPAERMVELCRATNVRLGLVTNGEQWMLVDAPVGAVTTLASWYARHWGQEPVTLQAFVSLLGIRRFFVDRSEQLPALLDNSLKFQDEVTDALGEQVRRAVEVLIQALDRADVDRNRELLNGIEPADLYEAGLTVMMRIVFLLSAEERGLLLLGDERYEANYAVSTLRMQLRSESEEILERRWDAWSRLLSIFRAVYGGVDHEAMRLPALGGSLFDPDRFPFLEGRKKGSRWKIDPATPLPIDNRTVLYLLDAVQLFHGRTLSYLALDVEQIGYVYEGLLERTVVRAKEPTLDLDATKNAKNPWVSLAELDDAAAEGRQAVEELLEDRTGSSASRVRNDLDKTVDEESADKLLTACHADQSLRDRIRPYFHLLRTDRWGYPIVYPKNTFMVRTGTDRRETGTHYTPKSLTETIVKETLAPIVYAGPAEGKAREEWQLKTPAELLELKVCDPAMGSGAFLVQACRWLSERMVESWAEAEGRGKAITSEGEVVDEIGAREPLRSAAEERLISARRLIAERCLYGVDMNPLAVELAKLSIWLVTLAKGRPFGFLDHNLRCGDSLLGITSLEQLHYLEMRPGKASSKKLFAHKIDDAVGKAIKLRLDLSARPINDIRDVEVMARLDEQARSMLQIPSVIADALVGEYVAAQGKTIDVTALSIEAGEALQSNTTIIHALEARTAKNLNSDLPPGKALRRPFHWSLEFPEAFERVNPGFDAMVGNPPFIGNKFWKERLGEGFQNQAKMILGAAPGKIDLSVVFHRRVADLLRDKGTYGLLATDNIAEGSAISVGLAVIVAAGNLFFTEKGMPWPGAAAVSISIICFFKGTYDSPKSANGVLCDFIGPRLQPIEEDSWQPKKLDDGLFSFEGVNNSKGLAFVITAESDWFEPLRNEPNSLLVPYVTGDDITTHALTRIDRWALDIADRDLDEIERDYPIAHRFILEVVKPSRTPAALKSYNGLIDRWWQFWNHRAEQMRRLRLRQDFIGYCKVTKYPICMLAPSEWIYTNKVILIGIDRGDELAITLSSFFRFWLDKFSGGRLEGRLSLSISESIAKFPLPGNSVSASGVLAAQGFNTLAVQWSRDNTAGMTDMMNAIHSPDTNDLRITELRRRLHEIDVAVAAAFGWSDLDLSYAFIKQDAEGERDKWRFQLPDQVTADVLTRLIELNRERSKPHEKLVNQGVSR
jgi:hypothetical protein